MLRIAFFVIGFAALPAFGESAPTSAQRREACEVATRLAETVMRDRQNGVALKDELDHWDAVSDSEHQAEGGFIRKVRTALVVTAYKRPLATGEKAKSDAIKSFGEMALLKCTERVESP